MARVDRALAWDGFIGHEYHDGRAISALEDLAKMEEELGAWKNSATWLVHALEPRDM